MLNTFEKFFTKSEIPIRSSGKQVYTTKKINSPSGIASQKNILLAQIILAMCILILVVLKTFAS